MVEGVRHGGLTTNIVESGKARKFKSQGIILNCAPRIALRTIIVREVDMHSVGAKATVLPKSLNTSNGRTRNRFKWQSFSERIRAVDMDVDHQVYDVVVAQRTPDKELGLHGSLFAEALAAAALLDRSKQFRDFWLNVKPLSESLPLLIHHKDEVLNSLLGIVEDDAGGLAVPTLLRLLGTLCRDLRQELYPHSSRILLTLASPRLMDPAHPALLNLTFKTLAYVFKFLGPYLLDNIEAIFDDVYSGLMSHSKPYIRRFAAESFAYLVRRLPEDSLKQSFPKFLRLPEGNRTPQHLSHGLASLMFQSVKNVQYTFHSCLSTVFPVFLKAVTKSCSPDELEFHNDIALNAVWFMCNHVRPEVSDDFWSILLGTTQTELQALQVAVSSGDQDIESYTVASSLLIQLVVHACKHRRGSRIRDINAVWSVLKLGLSQEILSFTTHKSYVDALYSVYIEFWRLRADKLVFCDSRLLNNLLGSHCIESTMEFLSQVASLENSSNYILEPAFALADSLIASNPTASLSIILLFVSDIVDSNRFSYTGVTDYVSTAILNQNDPNRGMAIKLAPVLLNDRSTDILLKCFETSTVRTQRLDCITGLLSRPCLVSLEFWNAAWIELVSWEDNPDIEVSKYQCLNSLLPLLPHKLQEITELRVVLREKLCQPSAELRSVALNILSQLPKPNFLTQKNAPYFGVCTVPDEMLIISSGESDIIAREKEIIRSLGRLEQLIASTLVPREILVDVSSFLIGMSFIKYQPIWEPVSRVIFALIRVDSNFLIFGPIYYRQIEKLLLMSRDLVSPDCSADVYSVHNHTVLLQLLGLLTHESCPKGFRTTRSELLAGIFLDFYDHEYEVLYPWIRLAKINHHESLPKVVYDKLNILLAIVERLRPVPELAYRIQHTLTRLLERRDTKIQALVVKSLCVWSDVDKCLTNNLTSLLRFCECDKNSNVLVEMNLDSTAFTFTDAIGRSTIVSLVTRILAPYLFTAKSRKTILLYFATNLRLPLEGELLMELVVGKVESVLGMMTDDDERENILDQRGIAVFHLLKDMIASSRNIVIHFLPRLVKLCTDLFSLSVSQKRLRTLSQHSIATFGQLLEAFPHHGWSTMAEFHSMIVSLKPLVLSLASHNIQSGGGHLWETMLSVSRYDGLAISVFTQYSFTLPSIISCLSATGVAQGVMKNVCTIVSNLMDVIESTGNEPLHQLLLNAVPLFLQHVLVSKEVKFTTTELMLLSRLFKLCCASSELAEQFLDALIPYLVMKGIGREQKGLILEIVVEISKSPGLDFSFNKTDWVVPMVHLYSSIDDTEQRSLLSQAFSVFWGNTVRFSSGSNQCYLGELLLDLTSIESGRINTEYDFERRLGAMEFLQDSPLTVECSDFAIPLQGLINALCFGMRESDLGLRGNSSTCLLVILDTCKDQSLVKQVYQKSLAGLGSPLPHVRREFGMFIGQLVSSIAVESHELVTAFSSISRLTHRTQEQDDDLISGLVNIQAPKRKKALTRLQRADMVDSYALSKVVIPLVLAMVIPEPQPKELPVHVIAHEQTRQYQKQQGLIEDAIRVLGILAGRLDWESFKHVVLKALGVCKRDGEECWKKVAVRVVSSVVEGFNGAVEGDIVVKKLLPGLRKYLGKGVAMAIVKLSRGLPKQECERQVVEVITRLAAGCRSKEEAIRGDSRRMLVRVTKELGPVYFGFIVEELRQVLKVDYQVNVLAYVVNSMLEGSDVLPGQLDYCLGSILDILIEDLSPDSAARREKGSAKEVKVGRTMQGLEALGRILSATSLTLVIERLEHNVSEPDVLREGLSKFVHGLRVNTGISITELFEFSWFLVSSDNVLRILIGLNITVAVFRARWNEVSSMDVVDTLVQLYWLALKKKDIRILTAVTQGIGFIVKIDESSQSRELKKRTKAFTNMLIEGCVGTSEELKHSSFAVLSTVMRYGETFVLTKEHLLVLLEVIEVQISDCSKQGIAFPLLKSIVYRKFVVPEIYDLMNKTMQLMVQSLDSGVRRSASQVLLQFLLDYPMKQKRRQQHIDFLVANMSYTLLSGRVTVLSFIEAILNKFPQSIVDTNAKLIFPNLVLRLVKEEDSDASDSLIKVIASLMKNASKDMAYALLDDCMGWCDHAKPMKLQRAALVALGKSREVLGDGGDSFWKTMWELLASRLASTCSAWENVLDNACDMNTLPKPELVAAYISAGTSIGAGNPGFVDYVLRLALYPNLEVRAQANRVLSTVEGKDEIICSIMLEQMDHPDGCVELWRQVLSKVIPGVLPESQTRALKGLAGYSRKSQSLNLRLGLETLCMVLETSLDIQAVSEAAPVLFKLLIQVIDDPDRYNDEKIKDKETAQLVLNALESIMGKSNFLQGYSRVRSNISGVRHERKQARREQAITNPEAAAVSHATRNRKKTLQKKRKLHEKIHVRKGHAPSMARELVKRKKL